MATTSRMAGKSGEGGGGNAEALIAAARQQVEKKDLPGAIATLEKAIAAPDCPPEARLDAATVFAEAGEKEKAVTACLDAGTHYLYDLGDMPKARSAFALAHQFDAGNLDVIFQMGQADVVEGRTQDALAKFIDVLRKSNLKHVPALFEAGCIYQANGQYDQAILAFKKVLDRDKTHVQAIVHMGQLHQTKGMVPESLGYYLQAAEIARESKQFGTAQQLCNMVLALDGSNQKARYMLDDLAERNQEIEDAAALAHAAASAPAVAVPAPAAAASPPVAPAQAATKETAAAVAVPPASVSADVAKSVEEAKRTLDALASQRAVLQKEMDDLAASRVDAEAALASARDEAEAAVAQRAAALATRSAAEIELAALTESLTHNRSQAQDAARRKGELDAELAAATGALNAAKKAESEIAASAEKRRAQIESELSALAEKKSEAEASAAASAQALTAARTQLSKVEADLQKARDDSAAVAASKSAEETAAAQSLAQARTQLSKVEADLQKARDDSAAVAASKSAEEKAAAQSLAQSLAQLSKVEADLQQAREDSAAVAASKSDEEKAAAQSLVEARAQLSKVEADLQKVRADGAAVTASKSAEEAAAVQSLAQAREELAKVEADLQKARDDSAAVAASKSAEEAAAANSAATVRELQAEIEVLTSRQAAALAEANSAATASVSAREKIAADVAAMEARVSELAQAKAAGEAAAQNARASLQEAQAQVDALAARQAAAQKDADSASDKRDKVRSELAAAEAQLATLQEQVKGASVGAADAKKVASASAKLKEVETAVQSAAAKLAETNSAIEAADGRKREVEEAYARSKSLAGAAEEKRAEATRAAEQAEALRTKREADAEAIAVRIATLEAALKDADAKGKLLVGESAALQEVTAKVQAQRKAMQDVESSKVELEGQRLEAEQALGRLRTDISAAQAALDHARADAAALPAAASGEPRRRSSDESYSEAVVATVPAQSCVEAVRTIESLAAEGEVPFEIAAEIAGLIHEGRAVEALRVARARSNLEAKPAPYLLIVGDLARDLGDAAGSREAYRTLAAADPEKTTLVHQRMGQLFLTFADQGTAAALARDDAHYAFAQDPAKALEAYAELVARFPNDPTFRQELGEVHERLGNTDAAGLAFTQAVTQYLAGDDSAKAVELVPKLLETRPDSGNALELAARAYERAGRSNDAQRTLDEALSAYRSAKSASDVERVCRRLADVADDPVPYRKELAGLLKEVGDIGGAAEQLLEAADKLLKWSNAADALALLREAAALAGDAEPLRDRIAASKEKAVEAQSSTDAAARAGMFLGKKQFEKAAEAYRVAVDKNPYNADACYQLACLLSDNFPDYATAEQLLENAAELRPGHTATRYRLALVKAERGEVVQAVELLIALARFDENNADFIDQFVERLEKEADGGSVAAKYRLGIAYRELGRVEEALVILQSIQRETEFIVLCLNAIGLCLRRQGLDTAAAKRFQKAIETPGYPENQYNEALYNLGDLYEAKRDAESLALSLSSFEELYARDCTYRDVADRIKSVKAKLGAAEGPKVKRLPNRSEAVNER